jgi:predicted phage baseplate assembly protein
VFLSDTPIAFTGTVAGASANLVSEGVTYQTYSKTTPITLFLTEGERFTETYTSTGLLTQRITLRQPGVITESISVTVAEGTSGSDVSYAYIPRILTATNSDRVFSVDIDANNYSTVYFGNNINGLVPTINSTITITYQRSRGSAGNVVTGAINQIESYTVTNKPALNGLTITPNTTAAAGGVDIESIQSLKANIPASFRSQDRAVSLQDYRDLVLRVPGIVRAAAYLNGSTVEIRAAAQPSNYGSSNTLVLTSDQVTSIQDYLEPREIVFVTSNVGASVSLTPVNFAGTVQVKENFIREKVYDAVVEAIYNLFSFDNMDFGGRVALGSVYRAITDVEGVDYAVVTRLTTTGSNVIDSSGSFTGVTASSNSMLVISSTSSFTLTPSGGIYASGG